MLVLNFPIVDSLTVSLSITLYNLVTSKWSGIGQKIQLMIVARNQASPPNHEITRDSPELAARSLGFKVLARSRPSIFVCPEIKAVAKGGKQGEDPLETPPPLGNYHCLSAFWYGSPLIYFAPWKLSHPFCTLLATGLPGSRCVCSWFAGQTMVSVVRQS